MTYEAVIIGGGPAALSAALYMGRYKRKTLVVTDSFGGLASTAGEVENYPGFKKIEGYKLIDKMLGQIKALDDIKIEEGEKVEGITKEKELFRVKTEKKTYVARGIIICAGTQPRKLGIDKEDQLIGKGLSYCATCDGPLSKGKDIIVIGGGRSATESAIDLAKIAKSITIININQNLNGEKITLDKLDKNDNITIINNAQTQKFITENGLIGGVEYKDKTNNKTVKVKAQMVFVEIGQIPNSNPFKSIVKTNKNGEIIINHSANTTSQPGIYACGDITNILFKQIIIACGEGAKAAMSLNRYLETKPSDE